ncbi:uncharacterized protein AAGF69_012661 [Amazona ochrocephala]
MCKKGRESIPEHPYLFESDVEICLIGDSSKSPIERFWNGNTMICILQKAVRLQRVQSSAPVCSTAGTASAPRGADVLCSVLYGKTPLRFLCLGSVGRTAPATSRRQWRRPGMVFRTEAPGTEKSQPCLCEQLVAPEDVNWAGSGRFAAACLLGTENRSRHSSETAWTAETPAKVHLRTFQVRGAGDLVKMMASPSMLLEARHAVSPLSACLERAGAEEERAGVNVICSCDCAHWTCSLLVTSWFSRRTICELSHKKHILVSHRSPSMALKKKKIYTYILTVFPFYLVYVPTKLQ